MKLENKRAKYVKPRDLNSQSSTLFTLVEALPRRIGNMRSGNVRLVLLSLSYAPGYSCKYIICSLEYGP